MRSMSADAYVQAAEDALQRLYLTRIPSDLVTLPTTAFPAPLPKQQKSVFDSNTPSLPSTPYAPFSFPSTHPTQSSSTSTIGASEILYGLNDSKDPNVVEDLKRPWWRPAKRDAVTRPMSHEESDARAKNWVKKEKSIATGGMEIKRRRAVRRKRRLGRILSGRARRVRP